MLKRGFLVLMLATGLAACDDDTPTAPADPNLAVFTAQLSAQNEVGGNTLRRPRAWKPTHAVMSASNSA